MCEPDGRDTTEEEAAGRGTAETRAEITSEKKSGGGGGNDDGRWCDQQQATAAATMAGQKTGDELEEEAQWYKRAVFYEVFVRSFSDGNADGIGDIAGLRQRLWHIADLGVDAVWLLPIMQSPLRDHGYDVSDFRRVHEDYGTLTDFESFVGDAHALGLKVVVEIIPNHTSSSHPWFGASRNPAHPLHRKYRDWYVWSDTDTRFAGARVIFTDSETSNWTWDPLRGQYYFHRFFSHQPDLNYDCPAVRAEMLSIIDFWAGLGVDGFRVDAPPYLFKREGTSCENLPETHDFFRFVRSYLDARMAEAGRPRIMLLSEAN
jgi:maltose alpha-D-glucosyltransferase/alpha-amylase